jgi:hypothetical protein
MTNPKDFPQLIPPHGRYRVLQSYQMFDDMLAWQEACELVKEVE